MHKLYETYTKTLAEGLDIVEPVRACLLASCRLPV